MKNSQHQTVAILLAAGASTRMKSSLSKLLHPLLGQPMIGWAAQQASWIASEIVVVVGHQREQVEAALRKSDERSTNKIHFALQEKQLGTADAVRAALSKLENFDEETTTVFIMGADSVFLKKESLVEFAERHRKSRAIFSVLTSRATTNLPPPYGRIIRNASGVLEKIVEVKEAGPEELAVSELNTGFYLVQLKALKEALQKISNTANKSREFYLTDLVALGRNRGWLMSSIEIPLEEALGVNTQEDLAWGQSILRDRLNSHWMREGVCIFDPKTTWIDANVQLDAGVILEQGVILRGHTKVAAGARVGAYSVIVNSEISRGVVLEAFCHLSEAQVGAQSTLGPFARMRLGSALEANVHLGNFVELKKSTFREGAKAGHLSYIGDSEVGKNANIGAGTITCNYDGFAKYKTRIGNNVFVGSNTSLVAPVELGEGAIIGAGSVVTQDVPADGMALERAELKIKPGAAKKFRDKRSHLKKGGK